MRKGLHKFFIFLAIFLGWLSGGLANSHLPSCPKSLEKADANFDRCIGSGNWGSTVDGEFSFSGEMTCRCEKYDWMTECQPDGFGKIKFVKVWKKLFEARGYTKIYEYEGNFKCGNADGFGSLVETDIDRQGNKTVKVYTGYFNDVRFGKNPNLGTSSFTPAIKSPLKKAFNSLSIIEKKMVQRALKKLGLYSSKIDGVYGSGTETGLKRFSQIYVTANLDLKKEADASKLINSVINYKENIAPKELVEVEFDTEPKKTEPQVDTKPKPLPETDTQPTIKPEPQKSPKLAPAQEPISKPKRDIEKEFGLSLYGSFLHTDRLPNALFFLAEIEQYDRFEFRKALRNHDIDLIVLSSPGGSVWEGLSMSGIIHDKGLNTYIPAVGLEEAGNCVSACAFMFFAGSSRLAEGKLGVHQFYSGDASSTEPVGEVQGDTQFTVSEIIGFLNEFETPSWVFERMFQQSEMYYFKESELLKLEKEGPKKLLKSYEKAEQFISEFLVALEEIKD